MAPRTTYSLNTQDLLRIASAYGATADELDRAAATAVNDVAKRARNNTRREIRAYLTLPAKSVNDRVELVRKASKTNPVAVVALDRRARGGNARPTLMSFKGKPRVPRSEGKRTKRGKLTKSARAPFSYQITKGGPRITLPGAFVQRPGRRFNVNGGGFASLNAADQKAQVFVRVGKDRNPLRVPRGPSIAAVWQAGNRNPIARRVTDDLRDRLPDRMQHQTQRILSRKFKAVSL